MKRLVKQVEDLAKPRKVHVVTRVILPDTHHRIKASTAVRECCLVRKTVLNDIDADDVTTCFDLLRWTQSFEASYKSSICFVALEVLLVFAWQSTEELSHTFDIQSIICFTFNKGFDFTVQDRKCLTT